MSLRVGIDLGTTNSCCYYEWKGRAQCLEYPNGKNLLPSYVEYKSDGSTVVGSIAKKNLRLPKSCVIHNTKRLIGKNLTVLKFK